MARKGKDNINDKNVTKSLRNNKVKTEKCWQYKNKKRNEGNAVVKIQGKKWRKCSGGTEIEEI